HLRTVVDGKTLILVTHRTALLALVDRLIVIDNGRIVADGPKEQVVDALREGRIGKAAEAVGWQAMFAVGSPFHGSRRGGRTRPTPSSCKVRAALAPSSGFRCWRSPLCWSGPILRISMRSCAAAARLCPRSRCRWCRPWTAGSC